ncbi:MAG: InlB B-repeat-containing protein [Bacilli bacterium]|jgi:uncharacterized repeat protein (TIGR02543 family)|nr:InlB B-repeat-containing protein [Bacilli bacterium]
MKKILFCIIFVCLWITIPINNMRALSVNVTNQSELQTALSNVNEDTTIILDSGFASELLTSHNNKSIVNSNYDIIIDGSNLNDLSTLNDLSKFAFDFDNSGTGIINFKNINIRNNGGFNLGKGTYEFNNITFENMSEVSILASSTTKLKVIDSTFINNSNSAISNGSDVEIINSIFNNNTSKRVITTQTAEQLKVLNSTFKNNNSGAIVLSSGLQSDHAKYFIEKSYFDSNIVTNNRGAALVYGSGSGYLDIVIENSVFNNNKAIGTSTASSGNNTVDGGAIAINADGKSDVTFNVDNSYFNGNFAQDDGGAILVQGSIYSTSIKSKIINSTFENNKVAGAQYGRCIIPTICVYVTDGSGGAINFYGMTESEITHSTFYHNGITGDLVGNGSSMGIVGGGGAIAVDTYEKVDINSLPPVPKLTNNLLVGNYIGTGVDGAHKPANEASINLINSYTSNALGSMKERSHTGNIFVFHACDADLQDLDTRGLDNNGNIGYDNGNYLTDGTTKDSGNKKNHYTDYGTNPDLGIIVKNIFVNYNDFGDNDDSNDVPIAEELTSMPIGAKTDSTYRYFYVPSPTSDELYRDGSGPYYHSQITTDTRGYIRDKFPNAGAVEIYWTKFDPGFDGGDGIGLNAIDESANWSSNIPAHAIKSLDFDTNNNYYIMTHTGVSDRPAGFIQAMPRHAIVHTNEEDYGFQGWQSNQPTNPHEHESLWEYELHQPGATVLSTKQVLRGIWEKEKFRVDFHLNYDHENNYWQPASKIVPYLHVSKNTKVTEPSEAPVRDGYVFMGWTLDKENLKMYDYDSDVNKDMTLYAKWNKASITTYQVIYHHNNHKNIGMPQDSKHYLENDKVKILAPNLKALASNYQFMGWNTQADGKGIMYQANDIITINKNINLYAIVVKNNDEKENKEIHDNNNNNKLEKTGSEAFSLMVISLLIVSSIALRMVNKQA